MSTNTDFWETLQEKYWAEYCAQDFHPSYKDFILWCEDKNLIPEDEAFYV